MKRLTHKLRAPSQQRRWPYCRKCQRIMTGLGEFASRRCTICGKKTRTFWIW